jgi:hypothetical protein
MSPICSVSGLPVPANNTKPLSIAMEKQEWLPCALLSNYKIFRTAVDNINVLRSSRTVPDIVVRFWLNLEFDRFAYLISIRPSTDLTRFTTSRCNWTLRIAMLLKYILCVLLTRWSQPQIVPRPSDHSLQCVLSAQQSFKNSRSRVPATRSATAGNALSPNVSSVAPLLQTVNT